MSTCTNTLVVFHFQFIKWRIHPKVNKYHTEWLLVTSDIETFEEFLLSRAKVLMGEYFKIKKKIQKGIRYHCASEDEYAVEFTLLHGRQDDRLTVVDDCFLISDKLLGSYSHYFFDQGMIFITEEGAIRPLVGMEYEVLKTSENNVLVWPSEKYTKSDINVFRWPGGKHYYAKVGNVEVISLDGQSKWSDVKEAERQASLFLRRINKKV